MVPRFLFLACLLLIGTVFTVDDAEARRMAGILREIGGIHDAGAMGQLRRISLLLRGIAEYCDAGDGTAGAGPHREALRLRELLESHALTDVPLAELYRGLHISPSHAGVLFKAAFGISPVGYRTRLRLRRARELLASSDLNVGQVALAVGFSDSLYFSRVFRKAFGTTPSSIIGDFDNVRK